jgi:transcriptional regulator with PAS, ATPase and Fis domain
MLYPNIKICYTVLARKWQRQAVDEKSDTFVTCHHILFYRREIKVMDLRVLEYFLAVAREENMTNAAQTLHVTQPTLSRRNKHYGHSCCRPFTYAPVCAIQTI